MTPLASAGFAAHTQAGTWVLAWDLETATLRDLYAALHLPFAGSWLGNASAPWQHQFEPAIKRVYKIADYSDLQSRWLTYARAKASAELTASSNDPEKAPSPPRR